MSDSFAGPPDAPRFFSLGRREARELFRYLRHREETLSEVMVGMMDRLEEALAAVHSIAEMEELSGEVSGEPGPGSISQQDRAPS